MVLVGYCHHLVGRDIAVHYRALSNPEGFLGTTLPYDEFSILKLDWRSLKLFLDKLCWGLRNLDRCSMGGVVECTFVHLFAELAFSSRSGI